MSKQGLLGSSEQSQLQSIFVKVSEMVDHVENVLEEACIESPNPAEFRDNPEMTFKEILVAQQALTRVSNTHTRVMIEDSRLWAFNEELKRQYGVVEMEAITKQILFYSKRLKDLSNMLIERKKDITQIIVSVRSIQSAYTNRFRLTGGN